MNSDIFLRASKKMLSDKLNININDSELIPIINHATNNIPFNDDNRTYNKDILRFILNHFTNNNTLESAVNHLDLIRNQPLHFQINNEIHNNEIHNNEIHNNEIHNNEDDVRNNSQNNEIYKNPSYINLHKNEYFKTISIHSIKRNINLYPNKTFFSFQLPIYSKIIPHTIIFDEMVYFTFILLKITDNNGTSNNYHFWKNNSNLFYTISDLQPIYVANNNNFTLALYNDLDEIVDIGMDNLEIKSITLNKDNYNIKFNKDENVNKFIINDLIFKKNDDNTYSCNNEFNINNIIHSKCIPILNNQIHIIFKQSL
jgi:hypothetical protein